MSTRTSIFKEISPDNYYGVYRHHDGYPEGAGEDLLDAIENNCLDEHMEILLNRYGTSYEDYSLDDIIDLWMNSDHEYGYIVHLNGKVDVYEIFFGPMLRNNKVEYMGELENLV